MPVLTEPERDMILRHVIANLADPHQTAQKPDVDAEQLSRVGYAANGVVLGMLFGMYIGKFAAYPTGEEIKVLIMKIHHTTTADPSIEVTEARWQHLAEEIVKSMS